MHGWRAFHWFAHRQPKFPKLTKRSTDTSWPLGVERNFSSSVDHFRLRDRRPRLGDQVKTSDDQYDGDDRYDDSKSDQQSLVLRCGSRRGTEKFVSAVRHATAISM